jgi:hypothetical protein
VGSQRDRLAKLVPLPELLVPLKIEKSADQGLWAGLDFCFHNDGPTDRRGLFIFGCLYGEKIRWQSSGVMQ